MKITMSVIFILAGVSSYGAPTDQVSQESLAEYSFNKAVERAKRAYNPLVRRDSNGNVFADSLIYNDDGSVVLRTSMPSDEVTDQRIDIVTTISKKDGSVKCSAFIPQDELVSKERAFFGSTRKVSVRQRKIVEVDITAWQCFAPEPHEYLSDPYEADAFRFDSRPLDDKGLYDSYSSVY